MLKHNIKMFLIDCLKCGFKALIAEKRADQRSRGMIRREARYVAKVAKKLGAQLIDAPTDRCPGCREPTNHVGHVKTGATAPISEIKKDVQELLRL